MTARKKLSAPQRAALVTLRDAYRREGLSYTEAWLYAQTVSTKTGRVVFRGPVSPLLLRGLASAGAVETRERATGHRDGRHVVELRFTAHGGDTIAGRAG